MAPDAHFEQLTGGGQDASDKAATISKLWKYTQACPRIRQLNSEVGTFGIFEFFQ